MIRKTFTSVLLALAAICNAGAQTAATELDGDVKLMMSVRMPFWLLATHTTTWE